MGQGPHLGEEGGLGTRPGRRTLHPYVADQLAEARHRDLVAQAEAEAVARRVRRARHNEARRAGATVYAWRVALGQRLVAAGLRLGMPPARRLSARDQAQALLAGDDLAADYRLPTPC
jgi:hypothetical protein